MNPLTFTFGYLLGLITIPAIGLTVWTAAALIHGTDNLLDTTARWATRQTVRLIRRRDHIIHHHLTGTRTPRRFWE